MWYLHCAGCWVKIFKDLWDFIKWYLNLVPRIWVPPIYNKWPLHENLVSCRDLSPGHSNSDAEGKITDPLVPLCSTDKSSLRVCANSNAISKSILLLLFSLWQITTPKNKTVVVRDNLPQIVWLFNSEKVSLTLFRPMGSVNIHVAHASSVLYFRQLLCGSSGLWRVERTLGLNTDFRVSMKENVGEDLETSLACSPHPHTIFN